MSAFTVTDLAGNILRTGTCPDDEIAQQAQAGELVQHDAVVLASPPDLAARKSARRAFIKSQRDALIAQPKATSAGTFDADLKSQVNLANVISLTRIAASKGYPPEANYTLASNERVLLTLDELETAALEMGFQVQTVYDLADGLFRQIEAATADDQVASINWPAA